MSPRKSGHWASLQQAMAPVQEETIEAQPVQETVETPVVPAPATNADSGFFMDDDFEIPANAFSLFDDEEKTASAVDDSKNIDDSHKIEELLIGETEEPPATESKSKWVVSSQSEETTSNSFDDDFEIPADAFSLYDDEEEAKPASKRSAKEKKSNKPVPEKPAKKEKPAAKAEPAISDKADKARKPRKEKKNKASDSYVEETSTTIAPEHVCEAIATGELDESVVHCAEVQTPVFYPVHQTEVAPVAMSEETVATEVTQTPWSSTSLLDDLIPDSEIDRVNQKSSKANSADKKTSKKLAKAESKAENKLVKEAKKLSWDDDDDDIPFDIPANAFSLPDYKVHLDSKKSESKPAVDKKREKCAKAEPVEVSKRAPLSAEDEFDIPADAFSMFDAPEEKPSKPVAKSRPAKPVREPKPVREERFEKEVREPRPARRREPVYEDESDEYPTREERRPERVAKPVRRPVEDMEEEEVQPARKTRDVRDGEVRRPAINIPSWRDVMDVLIDMNLNRRRETERPSRTARGPRNSDAYKPENYDDYEEKFDRQDRNNAPRRRQRRPE